MKPSKDTKCKQCGITYHSAYVSYEGYICPRMTTKCVKTRKKCDNHDMCMTCCLDGGHIVEYYGNGRHKWK